MVKNSKLPETHPKFKPIHFDRNFKLLERKLQKYLAKSCWYEQDNTKKCSWRSKLPEEWKGAKPIQQRMPGMTFSSLLQVQNSKNGRLIKSIAKIEPRLSKSTGYNVKIIKKGGNLFLRCLAKILATGGATEWIVNLARTQARRALHCAK